MASRLQSLPELFVISFTTGEVLDESPPEFQGLDSLSIWGCGEGFATTAACPTDVNGEGLLAILRTRPATDEAGAVNIEYQAIQIRGEERILRGRTRGDGASDVTVSVFIPASDLTDSEWERLCFSMSAIDSYDQENNPEQILCEHTPEYSPFGSACSAVPLGGEKSGWVLFVLGLLGLFSRSIRRCFARRTTFPQ